MPNAISERQNNPDEIEKLRAQRYLHAQAKRIVAFQIILTTGFPVAGSCALLLVPGLKGSLAFYSILISILDATVLEPWQKRTQQRAARIQEAFDCSVLELPWDELRVRSRPEQEDIHAASSVHMGGKADPTLNTWYPAAVAEVPLPLGRVICQRANLRWDSHLRRRYRTWLAGTLLVLGLVISAIGLQGGLTLQQVTLGVLAPIAPMLLWGIRQFQEHGEAAESSDTLREKTVAAWNAALDRRLSGDQLTSFSRGLQGEIYHRRVNAPTIFDWIYERLRDPGEEQMNAAAIKLVDEAKKRGF